jgi:hypothetical protein
MILLAGDDHIGESADGEMHEEGDISPSSWQHWLPCCF